jgi:hypothetical protein
VVLLAAVIGWFAPLFGVSLLAFLVVDGLLGWRARNRAPVGGVPLPREPASSTPGRTDDPPVPLRARRR